MDQLQLLDVLPFWSSTTGQFLPESTRSVSQKLCFPSREPVKRSWLILVFNRMVCLFKLFTYLGKRCPHWPAHWKYHYIRSEQTCSECLPPSVRCLSMSMEVSSLFHTEDGDKGHGINSQNHHHNNNQSTSNLVDKKHSLGMKCFTKLTSQYGNLSRCCWRFICNCFDSFRFEFAKLEFLHKTWNLLLKEHKQIK